MDGSLLGRRAEKSAGSKIIVVIAWVLLALNVLAVAGNLSYEGQRHQSSEAIEGAVSHLIQIIIILALGAGALILTTWLCRKNNYDRTEIVERGNI